MTRNDALAIVALFAAAWPWAEWPDATVELWAEMLASREPATAATAARRCVLECDRPPSIAAFGDRYRDEHNRTHGFFHVVTEWERELEEAARIKELKGTT